MLELSQVCFQEPSPALAGVFSSSQLRFLGKSPFLLGPLFPYSGSQMGPEVSLETTFISAGLVALTEYLQNKALCGDLKVNGVGFGGSTGAPTSSEAECGGLNKNRPLYLKA